MYDDVTDHRLTRPDGRTVAWTEFGPADGIPLLRFPGTPGCRWDVGGIDRSRFYDRGVHVITTERPGFGASTRLPGRGFREPVDDAAAVLDAIGIDRALVWGASGGSPHVLAFLARHGHRARSATIEVGAAPLADEEVAEMVEINQQGHRLAVAGDWDGMRDYLLPVWESMMADPVAGIRAALADADPADLGEMNDPEWIEAVGFGLGQALGQGVEGWADESMVMDGAWADVDLAPITTSITWWHGRNDRLAPFTAAERLVAQIPSATMRELDGKGHMGKQYNVEVLEEQLARG